MTASSDQEASVHPLSRHPTPWFEDGNAVLQAEETLFKVFKSMLSTHSLLFRSIFSLPQPTAAAAEDELYDGCCLVKVHDGAKHMATFLSAIFDPTYALYISSPCTVNILCLFVEMV